MNSLQRYITPDIKATQKQCLQQRYQFNMLSSFYVTESYAKQRHVFLSSAKQNTSSRIFPIITFHEFTIKLGYHKTTNQRI